jgi:hypothetical protein
VQLVNDWLERVEKCDEYPDGMLKSFDLLKNLIELAMHVLEVSPRRPYKATREKCEADCESDILRRSSCPFEESCFNASGQWVLG